MRIASDPQVNPEDFAVPIEQGGTSALSLAASAANLKLVTTAMVGQANGPVALDGTGKVDPVKMPAIAGTNAVNVQGDFFVIVNTTVSFLITDYDSFKNYSVTASVGTISRSADTITYTAPSTPQAISMTINGRVITFACYSPAPKKPVISVPANGSINVADTPAVISSAFVPLGDASTHTSTDWQIATDAAFTSIFAQSLNDTTNKTTWTAPNITTGTTFYLRNRYKGSNGNYSLYSDTIQFTTRATYSPNNEESAFQIDAQNISPQRISISDDGLRACVACGYNIPANSAKIVVLTRASGSWALEQSIATITSGSQSINNDFWHTMDMNAAGDRLIIGEPNDSTGASKNGAAQIWVRNTTTNVWTQETRFFSPIGNAVNQQFGYQVSMDAAGTRVMVTGYDGSAYYWVHVYSRSGTTWTVEQSINANQMFRNTFRMDKAGTAFIFVGGDNSQLCVYERSGVVWSKTIDTLLPSLTNLSGSAFVLSNGAQMIVYGNATIVGVLKRSGNTWSDYANTVNINATALKITADSAVILILSRLSTTMSFLRFISGAWTLSTAFGPVSAGTKTMADANIRADGGQVVAACLNRMVSFM